MAEILAQELSKAGGRGRIAQPVVCVNERIGDRRRRNEGRVFFYNLLGNPENPESFRTMGSHLLMAGDNKQKTMTVLLYIEHRIDARE